MQNGKLYRLAAFPRDNSGGNPAGVWVGDKFPGEAEMQDIAAGVGYSETAFVTPASGLERNVRYFSPAAEVPFCGHATIASGVALGRMSGEGTYLLATAAGDVPVAVRRRGTDLYASLTSVQPRHEVAAQAMLDEALAALDWSHTELDPTLTPVKAYAGAWHLVLAASTRRRLADLDYDFDRLRQLMLREDLTTVQLIWRESDAVIHARNPFPVGGVVEDAATGAAAAALGGYLRDAGLVAAPIEFEIRQGEDMGSPSILYIEVPQSGGIVVGGTAIDIGES